MSAQQVWVLQEEADLSGPGGDFHEWSLAELGKHVWGSILEEAVN